MMESFSLKKFFSGFLGLVNWVKPISYIIKFCVIAFVVIAIINSVNLFKKPEQKVTIKAEKGSQVTVNPPPIQTSNFDAWLESENVGIGVSRSFTDNLSIGIGAEYDWEEQSITPKLYLRVRF